VVAVVKDWVDAHEKMLRMMMAVMLVVIAAAAWIFHPVDIRAR